MTRTEVLARMQGVFDRVFVTRVVLSPELSAPEVPEWDSLAHITLLIGMEKAFAIRFRTGEVEDVKNVGEFADVIVARLSGQ
jgi:acyl carrier protein